MSVTRGYVGHELFCSIFCFPSPFRLVRAIIEVFNEEHNVKIFSLLKGSLYARGGSKLERHARGTCIIGLFREVFSAHTHTTRRVRLYKCPHTTHVSSNCPLHAIYESSYYPCVLIRLATRLREKAWQSPHRSHAPPPCQPQKIIKKYICPRTTRQLLFVYSLHVSSHCYTIV